MRIWIAVLVALTLVASVALAQHRQPPRTYGSPTGFGNILYPGMGTPPPMNAYGLTSTSFAHALGQNVAGRANYATPWPGTGQGRGAAVMPYIYPVVVGGYGYGYQQPNVTYVVQQAPPPQAPSQVVINQNFGVNPAAAQETKPALQEYTAPGPPAVEPTPAKVPAAEQKATIYLIAFNDGTVYSALAHWVEAGTLHYITTNHAHNRASLDLVDAKLSEQLNHERGVDFKLK